MWQFMIKQQRAFIRNKHYLMIKKWVQATCQSNKQYLDQALPLFKNYKIVVLGEREFC